MNISGDTDSTRDELNFSASSASFTPLCQSSPAPRLTLAAIAGQAAAIKARSEVLTSQEGLVESEVAGETPHHESVLSDSDTSTFYGFKDSSVYDILNPYVNISEIVDYMSDPEEGIDYNLFMIKTPNFQYVGRY